MVKVMTLNLNYFGDKHGPWPERRERIAAELARLRPDILALQAVRREAGVEQGRDQARQLAAHAPDYRYLLFQAAISRNGEGEGQAFLSRLPMVETGYRRLSLEPHEEDRSRRLLLYARFDLNGAPLYVANGHFSWVPPLAMQNAAESLPYLAGLPGPALFVGDLNAHPESGPIRLIRDAGWTDAWAALRGDEPGFTFEADAPTQRIDYVWANAELKTRLQAIDPVPDGAGPDNALSDHLGLIVSFK